MPLSTPVVFTLYDDNDEPIQTYSRARITTQFLEQAILVSEKLKGGDDPMQVLTTIDQLLVDFYGDKFTLEQVRNGGDVGEKMSVIFTIIERASGITRLAVGPDGEANPT